MKFSRPEADVHVPDGSPADQALGRTTHLCIGAHQDDIEIMAHGSIVECYGSSELHFTGVVATDGAGSPRTGRYAGVTDLGMQGIRRDEQRRAADLGRYNLQIQLAHPTSEVKQPGHPGVVSDLAAILGAARPRVLLLHAPTDKHDTHVALLLRCAEAIRSLPRERRPLRILGCEVWRGLDWLVDSDKVALDAGGMPELADALLKVFDSQISGGKRYDAATLGRRVANATYDRHHDTDRSEAVTWAVDLTAALVEERIGLRELALAHIDHLRADVTARIDRFG